MREEGDVRYLKASVIILSLLFCSVSSYAGSFKTAEEVYALCTTKQDSASYVAKASSCHGYVMGVTDHFAHSMTEKMKKYICLDHKITSQQMLKIFVKYVDENPKLMHHGAAGVVEYSVAEAFLCKD